MNLGVGHAFSTHFVGTLKGALTVAGDDQGTFKAELELAFLPERSRTPQRARAPEAQAFDLHSLR